MNRKRKLYFTLLLAFVFGLFSLNSKAFAEEMNSVAETAIEAGEVKADAEVNAAVDRESPAISDGKLLDGDQNIPSGGGTGVKSEPVRLEQPVNELKSDANSLNEEKANPDDEATSAVLDENAKSEEPSQDGKDMAEQGKDLESSEESDALDKKDATLEVSEEKNLEQIGADGAPSDALYLNGQGGDDNNDGSSPEKALKSFEAVKNKITETIKNIFVTGTTSVEGDVSLEGTNAKLVRDKDFNGYLLKVEKGKKATLKNIVIDGNSENNKNIEKSLVYVDGGILNIEKDAVLRNNKIKPDEKLNPTHGGAINARNHATVNMSGGSVEDNQATYGGGIQLYESTMNFTGGAVQNNRSEQVFDKPYNQYYSAGGGISVREDSVLNMSGDAKVLNNVAAEVGGGISVGSNNPEKGSVLKMDGGIVDGNTAGAAGGGIFIQAKYFSGSQGKAYINAGKITNNHMDGSGKTNMAFGGGGIYVNGASEEYGRNGELYIKNVLITDNKSEWEGAGMASCPISKTKIYVNDGGAIYGNKSYDEKNMNDLYILSYDNFGIHSGQAEYELSKWMLGGAPYNWTAPDGTPLPNDMHKGTLERNSQLGLNVKSQGNALTKALTKVIISGNYSATRGGGIGSNGDVIIGTEDGTTKVEVEKQWDDNENANKKRPDTIKVQLLAKVGNKEYLVETKEVKAGDQWKVDFKHLPIKSEDLKITYTVREVPIAGYESEVTGSQEKGFTITNKEKPEEPKTRDIKVSKRWDLVGGEKPVDKIDVELYRNGESTGKKLELNAGNNWSGEFKGLEIADKNTPAVEYRYSIKEVGEVNGLIQFGSKTFEVSYSGDMESGFILTNKEKPEIPPETPPTPPTRDIHIVKKWDLVGNEKPVARIEVELYRDGKATGKVLELNESNNWSGSFTGLEVRDGSDPSRDYIYTVKERGENGGFLRIGDRDFDVSYEGSMDSGFVITNKEKPEVPPETPPEEPEKPGKPNEPETPETPDVPDKPDKPNKPGNPGAPQTGDGFDMNLWAGLASLSVAALGFIGSKKRRDEE